MAKNRLRLLGLRHHHLPGIALDLQTEARMVTGHPEVTLTTRLATGIVVTATAGAHLMMIETDGDEPGVPHHRAGAFGLS